MTENQYREIELRLARVEERVRKLESVLFKRAGVVAALRGLIEAWPGPFTLMQMLAAMTPSQLLTAAKVAWVMDVSHSTVEQWVKRREIASFKKGKLRRFEAGAVLEFICRHSVKAKFSQPGLMATLSSADWERIERLVDAKVQSKLELNGHLEAA